ncbi:hypothetical protein RRG08_001171 [Elysia crispata]|uniref:Uncharacterized protein n=1 Tax=Elysia crispata TaxID=231223 RepID=A0AAE1A6H0_9GAST|nr:hypothetical protein RRG08_001171 [Elysia crispata]
MNRETDEQNNRQTDISGDRHGDRFCKRSRRKQPHVSGGGTLLARSAILPSVGETRESRIADSFRAASLSEALTKGVPLATILDAAGWSQRSTLASVFSLLSHNSIATSPINKRYGNGNFVTSLAWSEFFSTSF